MKCEEAEMQVKKTQNAFLRVDSLISIQLSGAIKEGYFTLVFVSTPTIVSQLLASSIPYLPGLCRVKNGQDAGRPEAVL